MMTTYTAFEDHKLLIQGALDQVVLKVKRKLGAAAHSPILIFSDQSGKTMDFNFSGSEADVLKRLDIYVPAAEQTSENQGPGRPKLGVISREVSLLPRHWEWLAQQSSSVSAVLRKMIEEAMKKSTPANEAKQAQERTYQFMSVIAGDRPQYEEALRALYQKNQKSFLSLIDKWPADIKKHISYLSKDVFDKN